MDRFDRIRKSRAALEAAESEGRVADNSEVRLALMAKVHSGEMTLEEAQKELMSIKRNAKKNGKVTRSAAYKGA